VLCFEQRKPPMDRRISDSLITFLGVTTITYYNSYFLQILFTVSSVSPKYCNISVPQTLILADYIK